MRYHINNFEIIYYYFFSETWLGWFEKYLIKNICFWNKCSIILISITTSVCIHLSGGRVGKFAVSSFEMYNFQSRNWIKLPDVPSKRIFASYSATKDYIYSVGGLAETTADGFTNFCQSFNLKSGESLALLCFTSTNFYDSTTADGFINWFTKAFHLFNLKTVQ